MALGFSAGCIFVLREDTSVNSWPGVPQDSSTYRRVNCQGGALSENFLVAEYDFDAELAKIICHTGCPIWVQVISYKVSNWLHVHKVFKLHRIGED